MTIIEVWRAGWGDDLIVMQCARARAEQNRKKDGGQWRLFVNSFFFLLKNCLTLCDRALGSHSTFSRNFS